MENEIINFVIENPDLTTLPIAFVIGWVIGRKIPLKPATILKVLTVLLGKVKK